MLTIQCKFFTLYVLISITLRQVPIKKTEGQLVHNNKSHLVQKNIHSWTRSVFKGYVYND